MAHRIVIIGGGAGGIELATHLGDRFGARRKRPAAQIVLVDRHPTHVWKPLLHQIAAGSMEPAGHQLEYAAQARWHGFEFQLGELAGLNRAKAEIMLSAVFDEDGTELLPPRALPYDTLIIAIGSVTHFLGVAGAEQHAIALDTVKQAERFHHCFIAACMRANRLDAGTRIRLAIVGGGATGVELSAELRNTAQILAAYGLHRLDPQRDIDIMVIEAGQRILPALPERISSKAAELLKKLNIHLMVGERIVEVSATTLRTLSGKEFHADLIVWAAGIRAPAVLSQLEGLTTNRLGQLKVRPTLQTENDDNIFALGDCASCPWLAHDAVVPPRAQAAHQQASFLKRALARRLSNKPLPNFRYHDFGSLVSVGRFGAIGHLTGGNLLVEGILAHFMYRWLYRWHIAALHGFPRMVLDTMAHWLQRSTLPRVKLH